MKTFSNVQAEQFKKIIV